MFVLTQCFEYISARVLQNFNCRYENIHHTHIGTTNMYLDTQKSEIERICFPLKRVCK